MMLSNVQNTPMCRQKRDECLRLEVQDQDRQGETEVISRLESMKYPVINHGNGYTTL